MGVYIKGVNKPKECTRCMFTYIYEHPEAGDYAICPFIPDEPIPQTGIDNRCPLIEVKEPHGRLVDFEEIETLTYIDADGEHIETSAQTVIEAESEGNNEKQTV